MPSGVLRSAVEREDHRTSVGMVPPHRIVFAEPFPTMALYEISLIHHLGIEEEDEIVLVDRLAVDSPDLTDALDILPPIEVENGIVRTTNEKIFRPVSGQNLFRVIDDTLPRLFVDDVSDDPVIVARTIAGTMWGDNRTHILDGVVVRSRDSGGHDEHGRHDGEDPFQKHGNLLLFHW